ncbi:serine/threonine protein kinase [Dipsacomyces acuminosporus]|nr:serine/threonine protein kinase [Dipsacomyces acuminosporus]
MCGSDPYMAPELFTADHYAAAKVDIWALGIIYFAMRHMQFPWAAAQACRDAHYLAFVQMPQAFFDAWFSASTADQWSARPTFLTTMRNLTAAPSPSRPLAAKDIMRRILDQAPATRAAISDIVNDPWFMSLKCCVAGDRASVGTGTCSYDHHTHWIPPVS